MNSFQKEALNNAFDDLNRAGYFAKQNWACCNSCGTAEIPDKNAKKYVFYHAQDKMDLNRTESCYLAWNGNGKEIIKIFNKHKIKTEWNNKKDTRIKIDLRGI